MGATAFWNRGVPTENAKFEKPSKTQKSQYTLWQTPLCGMLDFLGSLSANSRKTQIWHKFGPDLAQS